MSDTLHTRTPWVAFVFCAKMALGRSYSRYVQPVWCIFIAVALTEFVFIAMVMKVHKHGFTGKEQMVEVLHAFRNGQTGRPLRSTSLSNATMQSHIPLKADLDKTSSSGNTSREVQHVFFLKVHKAASSTVLNILYRFGYARSKNFVLPRKGNYIELVDHNNIIPIPSRNSYDILCNHLQIVSYPKVAKIMPQDTVYIGIVREPFERLHSSFEYYRNQLSREYLMKATGIDPFRTYIQNPMSFEPLNPIDSFTNNRMALDFGYPPGNVNGAKNVQKFLDHVDSIFDLVLVSDVFDESIILLRRRMNWTMYDVLYIPKNERVTSLNVSLQDYNRSVVDSNILRLDKILYDHFLGKLKRDILKAGETFVEEVTYFQTVRHRALEYCSKIAPPENLKFPACKWHDRFEVSNKDCWLLAQEETPFLEFLRNVQNDRLGLHYQDLPKLYDAKKMKLFRNRG
ncbi:galactose-3-O-sulfotransferase 2-like [Haliotis asinina]|uniref:galactose-3-O-sulfotransferase 2-like n=1 Tax=Haliotis asinina TaxID=109174 RepID=UPI003531DE3E